MKLAEAQQMEREFKVGLQKMLSSQGTVLSPVVATGLFHTVSKIFDDTIASKIESQTSKPSKKRSELVPTGDTSEESKTEN